ncbi:MAG: hypothetical protein OEM15_06135 [Myxococcales bacterium]|nr:hypothetical protein [Myxococcales bacterium]MDH3485286.1 hypothetical protein [Myxococcales bacterium]
MGVSGLKPAALVLALFLPASLGSAQWDPSTEPGTSTTATVAPTQPPAPPKMVETPPPAQPTLEETKKKKLEVGFTWALQVGVPVFLDVDRDTVKAGADISFFAGADFGYFIVGGAAGIGWNPIDLNNSGIAGLSGRSPVTRLFLSIPEFRVQVPDLKVVLPYVSGSFDINWWNFRETEVICGFYYCSQTSVYRFTPGFTGRGGLAFEAKKGIYVDLGLRYSFTGKGDFFRQSRWYLTPYVGVLVRRR